jgi:hypothetical protein
LEPVEETVVPLSDYFFSSIKKGIVKGRPKKRKAGMLEEESSKQYLIWNAEGLEPDKVAQETASALGAFASANAWTVNESMSEFEKQKAQVALLEGRMENQSSAC